MCGSAFGSLMWRHLTPQKNCNMDAQLQSLTCTTTPTIFWNIYFLYDFWCTQTCSFRAILDYQCELWQLLPALYSDVWKIIYIGAYLHFGPNYYNGILLTSFCYLFEVVHTNFFANFWVFTIIFDRNFTKIVPPPGNGNKQPLVPLKGQSLPKKWWKQNQNHDLPQTLHGDRVRQDHSKRIIFDPTHSFSYRVHRKVRGKWLTRGFSAITP